MKCYPNIILLILYATMIIYTYIYILTIKGLYCTYALLIISISFVISKLLQFIRFYTGRNRGKFFTIEFKKINCLRLVVHTQFCYLPSKSMIHCRKRKTIKVISVHRFDYFVLNYILHFMFYILFSRRSILYDGKVLSFVSQT